MRRSRHNVQLVIGMAVRFGGALTWFVHPAPIARPTFFGEGLTFAGASGTCAIATVIAWTPWNKAVANAGSCSDGRCG